MSLQTVIADIADALTPIVSAIPELQVYGYWNDTPTPPAIDVYPATPFQTSAGMGPGSKRVFLTVRARAAMGDPLAAQETLLRLLDPGDVASVEAALADIDVAVVDDGVSGFTQYADDGAGIERMLGCEWRVSTFL